MSNRNSLTKAYKEIAKRKETCKGKEDSKKRLIQTLNHIEVDRPVVDFGGTLVTGIASSTLSKLSQVLLDEKHEPIKVFEPFQMLGLISEELEKVIGADVRAVVSDVTLFGFKNEGWKPFRLFDGTDVLVPEKFEVSPSEAGGWYLYPQGDKSVDPSGWMPKDGFYFDAICRQKPIVEEELNPEDNLEEFSELTNEEVAFFAREAQKASRLGKGAILSAPGTGFGDIALVPATWMKEVRGIRSIEDWYMSTAIRKDYVHQVFARQCEIAIQNLDKLTRSIGDNVQAVFTTGTDFGTQNGLFISPKTYRELYMPYHKAINDFIHNNSNWKVFMHSCGSIMELIPDFIDAGFDILNPVQCSAANMDPKVLKKEFGKDLTFWGGGVDTQKTLPFGTPEEVYRETTERLEVFNEGGGFVFSSIHNIQPKTPVENILAMLMAVKDFRN